VCFEDRLCYRCSVVNKHFFVLARAAVMSSEATGEVDGSCLQRPEGMASGLFWALGLHLGSCCQASSVEMQSQLN
jgi:hypothetical protein